MSDAERQRALDQTARDLADDLAGAGYADLAAAFTEYADAGDKLARAYEDGTAVLASQERANVLAAGIAVTSMAESLGLEACARLVE